MIKVFMFLNLFDYLVLYLYFVILLMITSYFVVRFQGKTPALINVILNRIYIKEMVCHTRSVTAKVRQYRQTGRGEGGVDLFIQVYVCRSTHRHRVEFPCPVKTPSYDDILQMPNIDTL